MLAPVATRIVSYGLDVGPVTRAWVEAIFALPAFRRWEEDAERESTERPVAEQIGKPFSGSYNDRVPDGPCYAVIFASQRANESSDYGEIACRMEQVASQASGYLSHVSARGSDGFGITWARQPSISMILRTSDSVNNYHGKINHVYRSLNRT
jgi:hypothetical protein